MIAYHARRLECGLALGVAFEDAREAVANNARAGESESLLTVLRAHATATPRAIAIGAPGRSPFDYAGLLAHIEGVGLALRGLGVAREDRVAVVLPNGPDLATAFLGIASFAVAAPLNPAYRDPEFAFFLGDLRPKALVVAKEDASPSRAVAARLGVAVVELAASPDDAPAGRFSLEVKPSDGPSPADEASGGDVALVLHTSGTTSRPKMVPLSQRNLLASARSVSTTLALTAADRALNVMPLYHIHGLVAATLSSLYVGASVFATPGFDARKFFDWYDEIRPTFYTAVPTMHQAVLAAAAANRACIDAHRLRFARSSSAAFPPPVMAALEKALGAPVIEAYGMTEAAHQMASNPLPPAARKPGTVGPAAGLEIAILDAAGNVLGANVRGEIAIRGSNVTLGYLENPRANEAAFTHGFFRTGDEGSLDVDGYLTISGRIKEIINKAGEKISPREIDEVLIEHPAVDQVVTFAMPHPTLGEEVGVAIVAKPDARVDLADLRRFCRDRLAEFKIPQRVLVVDALPKGPTGKLKRVGLAEHFATELAASDGVAPTSELEEKLARLFAEGLGVARVGVHDNYFALGGDSLQAVMLAAKAKASGVTFSPSQLFASPTVAELAAILDAASAGAAKSATKEEDPPLEMTKLGLDAALVEDAFVALPFARSIVQRYEPRLSPSAFVTSWQLAGELDVALLRRAFQAAIARNPVLRSGFVARTGAPPIQFVARSAELWFALHELGERGTTRWSEVVASAHLESFDLQRPALFRVLVGHEGPRAHRLAVVWFHGIADLWSVGLIEREVFALYDAFVAGEPFSASEAASYSAFARAALRAPNEAEQHAFWRAELDAFAESDLLQFFRGPDGFRMPSGGRRVVKRPLPVAASDNLAAWARAHALTASTVFHGAWALVQARYLGVGDVLFGSIVSGRWSEAARVETVVGATMEVVPIRVRVDGSSSLGSWLGALQARLAKVQLFAHTPWETIASAFSPPRRNVPAFATLVIENLPTDLWARPSRMLELTGFEHATHMVPPLVLSFFPFPEPHFKATFDPALLSNEHVEALLDGMLGVIDHLGAAETTLGDARKAWLAAMPERWKR